MKAFVAIGLLLLLTFGIVLGVAGVSIYVGYNLGEQVGNSTAAGIAGAFVGLLVAETVAGAVLSLVYTILVIPVLIFLGIKTRPRMYRI